MERLVTGSLAGLALFFAGATFWLRGDGVPDWWLPVALCAGLALFAKAPPAPRGVAPRWARACAAVAVLAAFGALCYGAVATPSRHWDGAASFDAKVFWLTRAPTLHQPFFEGAGVFHHSPDYPLMQPLLVAMGERLLPGFGRAWLPLLYLLLCGVVSTALQRRGVRPLVRLGVTCAVALTPALLSSSGGSVDSGYSEISMLLATTTLAAGLLNRDARMAALGGMLAFFAKPEGLPYVMLAMLVAFARREPRLIWSIFLSLVIAQLCWGPVAWLLSHRHLHEDVYGSYQPRWLMLAVQAALTLAALQVSSREVLRRELHRWLLVLSLPLLLLLSLPWTAWLFTGDGNAMSLYLERGQSPYTGFRNLLPYFAALLDHGFTSLRLGTTLLLPLAIAVVARRRRVRLGDGNLLAFCLLGLAITALPFVMTIEDDLSHHLRSSLPRLLLHWVGPVWLLSGGWLDRVSGAEASPRDHDG